jgi:hypothetical protein
VTQNISLTRKQLAKDDKAHLNEESEEVMKIIYLELRRIWKVFRIN